MRFFFLVAFLCSNQNDLHLKIQLQKKIHGIKKIKLRILMHEVDVFYRLE